MGAPGTEDIRNVVLVGHGNAGKTSLAEAMLFLSKTTPRLGSVDAGQSVLDYEPEEIKHKFSINLALAPIDYGGTRINIIDTPGYADFIGDAIAGMEAAEMALFVVDAVSGPQVITDRLWNIADRMKIARAVFINKLDKEHASFSKTVAALRERYGDRVIPVQIPIGRLVDFKGVVDIIRMKAYVHDIDGEHVVDIPDELIEASEKAREALCDKTAEVDDDLMMKYLDGERLSQEELEKLLGLAIAAGKVIPVFIGSAITQGGVEDLMDEIVSFFPRPDAHGPMITDEGEEIPFVIDAEFSGHVFKTLSDPYVGRLSFIKIVSGKLESGSEVIDSRTGKKERITHMLKIVGKNSKELGAPAVAGDIVVIPKLTEALTNDTLSTSGTVRFVPLPTPEPLYPVALVAATKADEDKLGSALKAMIDEDPTLSMKRDEETHQTVICGLGDTAIEILIARLSDRYHVDTEQVPLRIPYRETVRKVASAQGRHKKQSGGSGQFGDCWLRIEPNPAGGYEFLDEIVGGRIPRQYIPAIDKGIRETMLGGVIASYPMVDIKVAVYDGSYHAVDSNEMAFRTAARIAFKAACEQASPVILEPMANLEIKIPDEYAGAVMSDMSGIRGRVIGSDAPESGLQTIKVVAPYAEVVHYSPHLRSITHGTGSYVLSLEGYEQVPSIQQSKIIAEHEAKRTESTK